MVIDMRVATQTASGAREYVNWLRTAPELVRHAAGGCYLLSSVVSNCLSDRLNVRRRLDARRWIWPGRSAIFPSG